MPWFKQTWRLPASGLTHPDVASPVDPLFACVGKRVAAFDLLCYLCALAIWQMSAILTAG